MGISTVSGALRDTLIILFLGPAIVFGVTSCGEQEESAAKTAEMSTSSDSTDNTTSSDNTSVATAQDVRLNGYIQKGPFVQGTEITVRELDQRLVPTGRTFTGTIEDNTGSFIIKGRMWRPFVELSADGFYFNEVSGSLSAAKLTLQGIAHRGYAEKYTVNVNLMTHLERKRVEYLMDFGHPFMSAKSQAQSEIMKIFNIENVKVGNSETLDISQSGDGNAVLLAISAILQSDKSEAELTELLSAVNTDIRYDGTLDVSATKQKLLDGVDYIKPRITTIRSNIEARYNSLGMVASIPAFESYVLKLDTTAPTIVSTDYTHDNNTFVSAVHVTFNDIIDHSSIDNTTFNIKNLSGSLISGVITTVDNSTSTKVTFTPSVDMSLSNNYTGTLKTSVKDLAGNGLATDQTWNFINRSDTTPPSVSSTSPADNATRIAVNALVAVTFSEKMSSTTITNSNFYLQDSSSNTISSSVSYSGTTATLTPSSNLSENSTFTSTVTTGVTDIAKNALASNYSWSFKIGDFTAPIAAEVAEVTSYTNDNTPSYTFSSTETGTITYGGSCSSPTTTTNLGYNNTTTIVLNSLSDDTYSDCTIKVTDSSGNAGNTLTITSFTVDTTAPTISSITPADNTTWVDVSSSLSVNFSEPMKASTLTTNTSNTNCSGTFQVSSDSFSTCVKMSSGPSASNSNQTFTLQPLDNLSHKTKYKTRLTTGAKDLADNPLSSDYTSDKVFTTFLNFTSRTVTSSAVPTSNSVYAIDLDGDGDMDILSSSASERGSAIAWYENNGSQSFTSRIITTSKNPILVYAADLDGDGDMDVLSTYGDNVGGSSGVDKIFWYENKLK